MSCIRTHRLSRIGTDWINKVINRPNVIRYKEELGTKPTVFYIL